MKVTIPYGDNGSVRFNVPDENLSEILSPNEVKPCDNPKAAIIQAMDNPIGSEKLEQIINKKAKEKTMVCIICDDVTRHTPGYLIIPPILEKLNNCGIKDENVFVIMALGTHRPMTKKEMIAKVGKNIYSRLKVYNSEFKDKSYGLVNMGTSNDGVPVWVDRRVAQANIKIGVGSVIPHPAAGCSGGAKILFPGVTGEDTVASFHLQYGATPQNLFGYPSSPSRESMECWAELIGLDFIVNIVSTAEDKIYKVVAGDYIKAHRQGTKFVRDVYGIKAKEKVDIAVVSSYPANMDFWQATKAVFAPDLLTKPRASIILVTSCPEGIGPHAEYADYIGDDDNTKLLKDAYAGKTAEPVAVSGGVTISRMRKQKRFCLVSGTITEEETKKMKFEYYSNVQQALDSELKIQGKNAKVGVMTHAGYSYPYFEN